MTNLNHFLSELSVGEPQRFQNLTMYPILGDIENKGDYLLLDEALRQQVIEISEVSEDGSVPDLKVQNKSAKRILLLDGEELLGAKQNRILNVSVMVPAKQTITIPVSCVEAGRWHSRSYAFASAGRAHYAEGRARKARRVSESLQSSASYRGSQGEVWHDISLKAQRMDAVSDTAASDYMYETHRVGLDEYLDQFSLHPQQVGVAFTVDGATTGIDVFDSADAMRGSFSKLVESYALDAIDQGRFVSKSTDIGADVDIGKFLDRIGQASVKIYPAVGEGEDYRLDTSEFSGGALVVDGRMVHLCAFELADENPTTEPHWNRMARASSRYRRA